MPQGVTCPGVGGGNVLTFWSFQRSGRHDHCGRPKGADRTAGPRPVVGVYPAWWRRRGGTPTDADGS